jgi:hypothetical protein
MLAVALAAPIQFDKTVHDFGEISTKAGKQTCTFTLTNDGDEALSVFAVVPSCGCTDVVWPREAIAPGEVKTAGSVECRLSDAMTKARQTLRFGSNEWHFWVYPREGRCAAPAGVVETGDAAAMKSVLAEGRTVLYTGPSFHSAKGTFKSVYWSARWFPVVNTTGAALGTWFDVGHPALSGFVTDDFTDWQWYALAQGATIHALRECRRGSVRSRFR